MRNKLNIQNHSYRIVWNLSGYSRQQTVYLISWKAFVYPIYAWLYIKDVEKE